MRWNIIVECVGEDGKRSAITLGTIERVAGRTTAENLGVNLQESKQIANRLQDTVVKQQMHEHCETKAEMSHLLAGSGRSKTSAANGWIPFWGPYSSGFRDIEVVSVAPAHRFGARFRKSSRGE
jgi:hypothetical protein